MQQHNGVLELARLTTTIGMATEGLQEAAKGPVDTRHFESWSDYVLAVAMTLLVFGRPGRSTTPSSPPCRRGWQGRHPTVPLVSPEWERMGRLVVARIGVAPRGAFRRSACDEPRATQYEIGHRTSRHDIVCTALAPVAHAARVTTLRHAQPPGRGPASEMDTSVVLNSFDRWHRAHPSQRSIDRRSPENSVVDPGTGGPRPSLSGRPSGSRRRLAQDCARCARVLSSPETD